MRASNTSSNNAIHRKAKRDRGLDTSTALHSPYSPRSPSWPMAKLAWMNVSFKASEDMMLEAASLKQRIERLDSDDVCVHVDASHVAHEAQAQHIGTMSNFSNFVPVGINVLRQ
jgi:hypothetical protein